MSRMSGVRWVLLTIFLILVCVGAATYIGTSRLGLALLGGLISFLVLVSAYSLIAFIFGWPRPKWGDVWAIGYLLP